MSGERSKVNDIFNCCRRGDIESVKYLAEVKEINLNVRDKWDSTPLYYACLCGHLEVVQYLLDNGARCDASSFDGERCIYGALTDQIRKLLRTYSVLSTSLKRREPFKEFLRRLFEDHCQQSDLVFNVRGHNVKAHRFFLSARSQYFSQQFHTKWKSRDTVNISNKLVDSAVFHKVIEWLYTGQIKLQISQCDDALRLCKQCRLDGLREEIEHSLRKTYEFVETKRGVRIHHVLVESLKGMENLQSDLKALANSTLPTRPDNWQELPFDHPPVNSHCDVIFKVQDRHFYCHKAVFCTRSEYFRALIEDHFSESGTDTESRLPVVPLHNVDIATFSVVVSHVYSNLQELTPEVVYDVLEASDMFLLSDLKRQCGLYLAEYLEVDNCVDMVLTARLYDIPKLEQCSVEFMASRIEDIVSDPKFRQLVTQDAECIKDRQATDTIDIIDEIRFVLRTQGSASVSDIWDTKNQLEILDNMLEDLGFETYN